MINPKFWLPKLVLLDRDGVINHDSDQYIKKPDEWKAISRSIFGIVQLQQLGIKIAVCTNQAGIGRGLIKMPDLFSIHRKFNDELIGNGGDPLEIFFCPHLPSDSCDCRKPKPGLLITAISALGISCKDTIFLGDSITDFQAAKTAGVKFALVLTGNGKITLENLKARDYLNVTPYTSLSTYANSLQK
jgi:D-glycero-D-manno-heptose 1,7-bisphosphate phosphatase